MKKEHLSYGKALLLPYTDISFTGTNIAFIYDPFYNNFYCSGVRICTYDFMRKEMAKSENGINTPLPLYKSALCGVFSGGLAQWLASPADLVKVQIQMEGKRRLMGEAPRVHGAAHALKEIVRRGGVKGLWKGSIPNVQRAALVNLGKDCLALINLYYVRPFHNSINKFYR